MREKSLPVKEGKETVEEQVSSEENLKNLTSEIEDENSVEEEKEQKSGHSLDEEQKSKDDLVVEDLEIQASKKYVPPGCSKRSHHRGRFTSTWVQYSDGLGYAYGGADTLNYDPTTKNRFIRRVFVLVLIMLMITSVYNFCASKMDLKRFYQEDSSFFVVVPTAIVMVTLNCFMAIFQCTRSTPVTHICLLLNFVGTCIVSGCISGRINTLLITYVYVTTSFVSIGLIIIANTSYNFTHWTLHIIGVCIALPFVLVFFFIAKTRIIEHVRPPYPMHTLILFIFGALLYVLVMTIMLRIILGSQAVEILENDYTLGAFYLYTSIYDIYIKIIQIIVYRISGDDEDE